MMENITIHANKETVFDFEASVRGLDLKTGKVLFMVDISDNEKHVIACEHVVGIKWSVKFPENTFKPETYNYTLSIIIDGYYFEPMSGSLNVFNEEYDTIDEHNGIDHNKEVDNKEVVSSENVPEQKELVKEELNEELVKEELKETKVKISNDMVVKEMISNLSESKKEDIKSSKKPKKVIKEDKEITKRNIKENGFTFFETDHPYSKLSDRGEKDKKVKNLLKGLKIGKFNDK
jgi:excinuclease UvrABC ATPase subunit